MSQISLRFALRSLLFQITGAFDFSIEYNGEFEIFENKSLKIWNSKCQNSPTWFCGGTMEVKFSTSLKIWLRFLGIAFWNFLIWSNVNETNHSLKIQFTKFPNPKCNSGKAWKLVDAICMRRSEEKWFYLLMTLCYGHVYWSLVLKSNTYRMFPKTMMQIRIIE